MQVVTSINLRKNAPSVAIDAQAKLTGRGKDWISGSNFAMQEKDGNKVTTIIQFVM